MCNDIVSNRLSHILDVFNVQKITINANKRVYCEKITYVSNVDSKR